MKITKYDHSCILLDDGKTKILFDPGLYSDLPPDLAVYGIVITHVHQDHLDIEKHKTLLNSGVSIITNSEVKAELDKHNISSEVIEEGDTATINTFTLEAFGKDHAIMHPDLPKFQNTGYLVNDKILHPGDALLVIDKPIDVLLLPVAAPWSKVEETLDYIAAVKAPIIIPIHDGFIKDGGAFHRFAKMWCEKLNLQFIELEFGKTYELSL